MKVFDKIRKNRSKNSKQTENISFDDAIVFVGNPNTGKTTFFNAITNSEERVGNWHGVTVDYKEKTCKVGEKQIKVVDLPGLYSLSCFSYEEKVARDYIYTHKAKIINICDANNLVRNLYLTLQLLEMGIKPIVCINMANELKKQGKMIDAIKLSKQLKLKVFLINAQNKNEVKSVIQSCLNDENFSNNNDNKTNINIVTNNTITENIERKSICSSNEILSQKVSALSQYSNKMNLPYLNNLPLIWVENIFKEEIEQEKNFNWEYVALKLLEKDEYFLEKFEIDLTQKQFKKVTARNLTAKSNGEVKKLIENLNSKNQTNLKTKQQDKYTNLTNENIFNQKTTDQNLYTNKLTKSQKIECLKKIYEKCDETNVATERYLFLDKVASNCITNSDKKQNQYGYSKLDKIFLNKYLALPLFIVIISLIFFLTFSSIGKILTNGLSRLLETFVEEPILCWLGSKTNNYYIISFVKDAIFGGVGSLISFVPQIAILFMCLQLLEDFGYLSRLAFTLEDFFAKIGLSGKSVFALLMGFGCATTSAMTSRNMEDKNSKIKTAILSGYLSCSAKIPLYTIICSAFFFDCQFFVIVLMYLLSVMIAIVVSFILEKTILKSGEQSFIMELPPYRFPKITKILKDVWASIKSFVIRVGTMIVSFSVIIWILQTCDFSLKFNPSNSILLNIGKILAPTFSPLGFGKWSAVVCLLCGIVAKEIIASTMGIINNLASDKVSSSSLISQSLLVASSPLFFTKTSALSFLVFSVLYLPCISIITVLAKEIGTKWTIKALLIQFSIAYITTFVIYKIALCFEISGIIGTLISAIAFVFILACIIYFAKIFKSKNKCIFCPQNKNCKEKRC